MRRWSHHDSHLRTYPVASPNPKAHSARYTMSGSSRLYRPVLNASVDVKLQTAFNDGQWSIVSRLAAQRYKMGKDPYYEVQLFAAPNDMP